MRAPGGTVVPRLHHDCTSRSCESVAPETQGMTTKPFNQPRLALEPLARPTLPAERTEAARNAANTVVVGWLLVGRLDDVDRQAALAAHARTAEALSETFGA